MSCCQSSTGVTNKIAGQMQEKLEQIATIFMGVKFPLVLNGAGQLVASSERKNEYKDIQDVASSVSSLKTAVTQFTDNMFD
jgi:hypothetical protein